MGIRVVFDDATSLHVLWLLFFTANFRPLIVSVLQNQIEFNPIKFFPELLVFGHLNSVILATGKFKKKQVLVFSGIT